MEDKYAEALLSKVLDIEEGLRYYIDRCHKLENDVKVYENMYEHRVEEYIKLENENENKK